jgi:TonB family protein
MSMRSGAVMVLLALSVRLLAGEAVSKVESAALDKRIHEVEQMLVPLGSVFGPKDPDFRGRIEVDDVKQWCFPDETLAKLRSLRKTAASRDAKAGRAALDEANAILDASIARAKAIHTYWTSGSAPYWRRHWDSFAEANALPPSDVRVSLLTLEADIAKLLAAGEFERAANEAVPALDRELHAAMARAESEKAKGTSSASLDFRPRSTPCPPEIGRTVDSGSKAKLARADPLQTFYPASSLFREEQGDIVLRTHVNAAGCATDVAIVVHSGSPQLDAAALKWFETGHFLPEYADGKAVDKELTFKVRFKLRDES